jgi:hypothetical protein
LIFAMPPQKMQTIFLSVAIDTLPELPRTFKRNHLPWFQHHVITSGRVTLFFF